MLSKKWKPICIKAFSKQIDHAFTCIVAVIVSVISENNCCMFVNLGTSHLQSHVIGLLSEAGIYVLLMVAVKNTVTVDGCASVNSNAALFRSLLLSCQLLLAVKVSTLS